MILDEIVDLLKQLVILKSESHYDALALWIAHTFAIPEFDFTPRLGVWSPEKRCGKSLLLEIISYLVPRKIMTSSISSAALFRIIAKDESVVILMDESDTVFGRNGDKEKAEALRQIMNSGFKRGVFAIRCEAPSFDTKEFATFSPMVIAGIGTSAIPETVADRSILIEMKRKTSSETIREFESDEVEEIFTPYRIALGDWVKENSGNFRASKPEMPSELNSRARDVWKPLYKIAESAGQKWREKAWSASLAFSSDSQEEDEVSLSLKLLEDIRGVFQGDRMATKDLLNALREEEESPWAYMDGFNPHLVARILKDYGIHPKPFGGGKVRGYYRKHFEDAWSRYLPESVTSVTSVTFPPDLTIL
jgi:hypothetical protein